MNFVIIDLDQKLSSGQEQLVEKYYRNLVPHVMIVDSSGKVVYNEPGEVEEARIISLLDQALNGASHKP